MTNKTINNKKFLEYIINNSKINLNFIKSIKFNKKSITVKIDPEALYLIFNDLFNKNTLYNLIIDYLILFIKDNQLNYPTDKDFLKYKFKKINYYYV